MHQAKHGDAFEGGQFESRIPDDIREQLDPLYMAEEPLLAQLTQGSIRLKCDQGIYLEHPLPDQADPKLFTRLLISGDVLEYAVLVPTGNPRIAKVLEAIDQAFRGSQDKWPGFPEIVCIIRPVSVEEGRQVGIFLSLACANPENLGTNIAFFVRIQKRLTEAFSARQAENEADNLVPFERGVYKRLTAELAGKNYTSLLWLNQRSLYTLPDS